MTNSTFIVRIQLIKEIVSNYKLVNNGLSTIGFSKNIKSKQGVEYRLPNGNYLIETSKTIEEITDIVINIVTKIDKKAYILITESINETFFGLDKC